MNEKTDTVLERKVSNVDRLVSLIRRPKKEAAQKKPSNFALWWAWVFYNFVAFLFDVITAITVYALTGKWYYAVLVFVAGFAPLLMHEFLYMRPYANKNQKIVAIAGAGMSVMQIIVTGMLCAVATVLTIQTNFWIELAIILATVLVSFLHGIMAAIYFYIDDGEKAKHAHAESVAYADGLLRDINLAKMVLAASNQAGVIEEDIIKEYGQGSEKALGAALGVVRGDQAEQAFLAQHQDKATSFVQQPYRPAPPTNSAAHARTYTPAQQLRAAWLSPSNDDLRASVNQPPTNENPVEDVMKAALSAPFLDNEPEENGLLTRVRNNGGRT